MAARTVRGIVFTHSSLAICYLDVSAPFDIPQCAQLARNAQACANERVGRLKLQPIEHPAYPDNQGFVVFSDRRGVNPSVFAVAVRQIFKDKGVELKLWTPSTAAAADGDLARMAAIIRGQLANKLG